MKGERSADRSVEHFPFRPLRARLWRRPRNNSRMLRSPSPVVRGSGPTPCSGYLFWLSSRSSSACGSTGRSRSGRLGPLLYGHGRSHSALPCSVTSFRLPTGSSGPRPTRGTSTTSLGAASPTRVAPTRGTARNRRVPCRCATKPDDPIALVVRPIATRESQPRQRVSVSSCLRREPGAVTAARSAEKAALFDFAARRRAVGLRHRPRLAASVPIPVRP